MGREQIDYILCHGPDTDAAIEETNDLLVTQEYPVRVLSVTRIDTGGWGDVTVECWFVKLIGETT